MGPKGKQKPFANPFEITRVMYTIFPAPIMVLSAISNEEHVIPAHLFPEDPRINYDAYIDVLGTVVKPVYFNKTLHHCINLKLHKNC